MSIITVYICVKIVSWGSWATYDSLFFCEIRKYVLKRNHWSVWYDEKNLNFDCNRTTDGPAVIDYYVNPSIGWSLSAEWRWNRACTSGAVTMNIMYLCAYIHILVLYNSILHSPQCSVENYVNIHVYKCILFADSRCMTYNYYMF